MDKIGNLFEAMLESNIAEAQSGNREIAKKLLSAARLYWAQGKPLPTPLAEYFSEAFSAIESGKKKPANALYLVREKTAKRSDMSDLGQALYLTRRIQNKITNKRTLEDAIFDVIDEGSYGLGFDRLKDIYLEHREGVAEYERISREGFQD